MKVEGKNCIRCNNPGLKDKYHVSLSYADPYFQFLHMCISVRVKTKKLEKDPGDGGGEAERERN